MAIALVVGEAIQRILFQRILFAQQCHLIQYRYRLGISFKLGVEMQITVTCDRCHNLINGIETKFGTGGFYLNWTEFMSPNEKTVCDECMWQDPRYIAVYGMHT